MKTINNSKRNNDVCADLNSNSIKNLPSLFFSRLVLLHQYTEKPSYPAQINICHSKLLTFTKIKAAPDGQESSDWLSFRSGLH